MIFQIKPEHCCHRIYILYYRKIKAYGGTGISMKNDLLSLEHKELLYQRLRDINTGLSEYSFSNLYLFRKEHNYSLVDEGDIFITAP